MKISFKKLDHIMLCIPEGKEEEAREFYTNTLGLPELKDLGYPLPNGAIWFQMGDIQLHVRAEKNHSVSDRHPAFEVHNLAEARTLLEKHNIEIKNESKIPDRNRLSFRDPFGNRIELIEMT
ncbi:VOC family protein [Dyadobacter sp. CY343]|uniref:VOC family protein n=1 Tax=Dyadobacter sp. CY343 TaxID=2907299 RepID=UPI001F475977|nr:VOC family protein [Dyadobacter sp. CY343]MCE7059964.1 VOC family protein [Dyadobacter sp. CY343]